MFLDFLKAGLVDRKTPKVNWDPVDKTVLANEQVIDGARLALRRAGRAARADAVVLQDLGLSPRICLTRSTALDRWPEKVRLMQAQLDRPLAKACCCASRSIRQRRRQAQIRLEIYTTRPDTLFGASFMALAPDHPLAKALAANNAELAAFIDECRRIGTVAGRDRHRREEGLRHRHPRACIRSIRAGRCRSMSRISS